MAEYEEHSTEAELRIATQPDGPPGSRNSTEGGDARETQRVKPARVYFEDGCSCTAAGALALSNSEDDKTAVSYYEENCHCSRNPMQQTSN
jgi:hypothetical protein